MIIELFQPEIWIEYSRRTAHLTARSPRWRLEEACQAILQLIISSRELFFSFSSWLLLLFHLVAASPLSSQNLQRVSIKYTVYKLSRSRFKWWNFVSYPCISWEQEEAETARFQEENKWQMFSTGGLSWEKRFTGKERLFLSSFGSSSSSASSSSQVKSKLIFESSYVKTGIKMREEFSFKEKI